MSNIDENAPVIVYDGTYLDAAIVKSMLEDANIECFFKDELMGTLAPWDVVGGGAGAVKLVVANHNYVLASQIVEEFEKNTNQE